MFIYLLIYLLIYLFAYLFIYLFVYLFICLFIYLFTYLFAYLCIYLLIYFLVYLFICLFIYLLVYFFAYLFIYLFMYLFGVAKWRFVFRILRKITKRQSHSDTRLMANKRKVCIIYIHLMCICYMFRWLCTIIREINNASSFFLPWLDNPNGPRPPHYRGFTITLRHTTVGTTPLDEWSGRHRNLYLHKTQHSQETDIHAPDGIRTHNPSRRAAADPPLERATTGTGGVIWYDIWYIC
jgi:hypothetical protein